MPGAQERVLRTRIRTVQATKKITRAMELIAASRIVRAQGRVAAARPYSEKVTEVIANLARGGAGLDHALLRQPESVSKVAYIVVAADRGLAGGYNNNVLRATERAIAADRQAGRDYELVLSGKKTVGYFRFRKYRIAADFQGYSDTPTYADAARLGQAAADLFYGGEVQQVRLVYTQFLSARPPAGHDRAVHAARPGVARARIAGRRGRPAVSALYEFEPDPDTILGRLLPSYAEVAAVLRPARGVGVGARRPSAGHEVGHRQRRGPDHHPLQGAEPRPPGRHHHRDHGDRRRCRGPEAGRPARQHGPARGSDRGPGVALFTGPARPDQEDIA